MAIKITTPDGVEYHNCDDLCYKHLNPMGSEDILALDRLTRCQGHQIFIEKGFGQQNTTPDGVEYYNRDDLCYKHLNPMGSAIC